MKDTEDGGGLLRARHGAARASKSWELEGLLSACAWRQAGTAARPRRSRCLGGVARDGAVRRAAASDARIGCWFSARDVEGRAHIGRAVRSTWTTGELEPRLPSEPCSTRARSAPSTTAASTRSCVVERRRTPAPLLHRLDLGRDGAVLSRDRLRGQRRRRRTVRARVAGAGARAQRRRSLPDRVAVGPARRRPLAHVVRVGVGLGAAAGGRPQHRYHISYAESRDGVDVGADRPVCIDFADESEYAFARPWVLRDGDRYRMWFSHRGQRYRIGYAESRRRADLDAAGRRRPGWRRAAKRLGGRDGRVPLRVRPRGRAATCSTTATATARPASGWRG